MSDEYEVMGVYSHSSEYECHVGERNSRHRHGTYWFVRKVSEEMYEVRPINGNHVPSGVTTRVSRERFVQSYTPELTYYEKHTLPSLESLHKKVRMGRRFFNLGKLDKAEKEFAEAILMQEDSIPGNIGLSEVYAEQQEFSKLRAVLDKLLNIDEVFREEQRHRFNEFGINLRKKSLYDDAIRFYSKALEVNERDENLHFNIARAYHGKQMGDECQKHLERALILDPKMAEAKSFLRVMQTESATAEALKERNRTHSTTGSTESPKKKGLFSKKQKEKKTPKKGSGKAYVFDI